MEFSSQESELRRNAENMAQPFFWLLDSEFCILDG
jgi:hypothetical protein